MFVNGSHKDLAVSLEKIGAAFAIFERESNTGLITLISANTSFAEITLKPIAGCIDSPLSEIFHRPIEQQMQASFLNCLIAQAPQDDEIIIEQEGNTRWWRFITSPIFTDGSSKQRIIVILVDISEKKFLERQLSIRKQRFEAVVQTAYDGIITIDEQSKISLMNEAARSIFRIGDEKIEGTNLSRFIPLRYQSKHAEYVNDFKESTISSRPMQARAAVSGLRTDGSEFPLEVTISKIQVGNQTEMTAVIRDVSESSNLIEELSKAARYDGLTKLLNRQEGAKQINHEYSRSKRFDRIFSLAMLDIDYFKAINDSFGHSCGDKVLISTANLLVSEVRETDMVCRWGGEEFLVLLLETPIEEAKIWAERMRELIEKEITHCPFDKKVKVTVSIGLAQFDKQISLDNLVDSADKALYMSKNNGRNQVSSF